MCIFTLLLLLTAVSVRATSNSIEDDETNTIDSTDQCGAHCLNVIQPLVDHAVQIRKEIERFDVALLDNDEKMEKIEEKLAATHINESVFNEFTKIFNEQNKYKDELFSALKEKSCSEKTVSRLDSIKAQLDENTAALKVLKTQFDSLNSSLHNNNAKQQEEIIVKTVPMNCVPFGNSSGIHEIDVADFGNFSVLCDGSTAGPGWMVVQRRFDGTVDFNKNWSHYKKGFGSLDGEFFIGLEKLYRITKSLPYELYIELVDFKGEVRFAHYDNFLIGSEEERFFLKDLGTYWGNAGNALKYNLHDGFTTYDRDNDGWNAGNCADWYKSGGWFNLYGNSNLNGLYFNGEVTNEKSIWWYPWKGYTALKSVKMMIKPKYTSL